jgi:dTDP-4-amino-4,6-dideoxygalactose transaminase
MEFVDLKAQLARIRDDVRRRIDAVLEHGAFILGPEVAELEQRLAAWVGVRHCVSVASGTDALLVPLMIAGIGPGNAVVTTPFSFMATAEVIALVGATPVFVDIDPVTFNLDPARVEAALTTLPTGLRARAIIAVDLFGLPADYDALAAIARRHELLLLEDAAQGLGGSIGERRAGALAPVAATSFFPAKPLGGYGDGGAIFTDDDAIAEAARSIRAHGKGGDKYDHVRIGLNARLDTIQAAILLAKLAIFDDELARREEIAARYGTALPVEVVQTPRIPAGYRSAWAQYSVLADDLDARSALTAALKRAGVPTAVYYPKPLHLQPAFASLGYREGSLPIAEATSRRIFSLPMHPYLPVDAQALIARVLADRG